jgi:hypothetical protein
MKLFLLLLASALITSCKKNDTKQSCSLDMASIAGTYKITTYTYRATPTSPPQDFTDVFLPNPCERDDSVTLSATGSYVYKDAGVVCSPPRDTTGTWSLTGATLILDGTVTTVKSFNCQTLILANTNVSQPGDEVDITFVR